METPTPADVSAVSILFMQLLTAWNHREASEMAGLFLADGHMVGFDGSQVDSQAQIAAEMGRIFCDHATAAYVGKIREIHQLAPGAILLRAVAGMVAQGSDDLNPALNAVQSLVVVRDQDAWRIALFHTTPAQFYNRPEASAALTAELRALLNS